MTDEEYYNRVAKLEAIRGYPQWDLKRLRHHKLIRLSEKALTQREKEEHQKHHNAPTLFSA